MSLAPGRHFRLEIIDGITVVHLVGPKLSLEASGPLYDLVEQDGPRRLLLNFGAIRFLSSAPLGVLVTLKKKVDAAGGDPVAFERRAGTRRGDGEGIADRREPGEVAGPDRR